MENAQLYCMHCGQKLEAGTAAAGTAIECSSCRQSMVVPETGFQAKTEPSPSIKPSVTKATPKRSGTPTSPEPAVAACQSCGAQLDLRRGEEIATCLFCGSKNMVHAPKTLESSLLDLDEPTLDVGYLEPSWPFKSVRNRIIETIKRDECGLKNADSLSMEINGVFFPFWMIRVKGISAWVGENGHSETYTEWRTVTKDVNGRRYETNEPVQKTRTVWTPFSGQAYFDETFEFPAATGLSDAQVKLINFAAEVKPGTPPDTSEKFSVTSPSISQGKIWSPKIVEAAACKASAPCVQQLSHVSPQLQFRFFTLVYRPFAVVKYDVDGSEYRHFVNLGNGEVSGDFPLDVSAVAKEAAIAWQHQQQVMLRRSACNRNIAVILIIAAILLVGAFYFLFNNTGTGSKDDFIIKIIFFSGMGLAGLVGMLVGISPKGNPWNSFCYNRLAFLLRLWLNAPGPVRQALDILYPAETTKKIRDSVREAAAQNELDGNSQRKSKEIYYLLSFNNLAIRTAQALIDATGVVAPSQQQTSVCATTIKSVKDNASLIGTYLTVKRCVLTCVCIIAAGAVIWGGYIIGIRMKQKSDYRNALQAKNYEEVARICTTLAKNWEPAAKYLEYWNVRQAFENANKNIDTETFAKIGGEKWTEIVAQRQLGEECVRYSYRYQEGKAIYIAALAKFNEIKVVVDQDAAFRARIKEDFASVLQNFRARKGIEPCLESFPADKRAEWKRAADVGMSEGQWLCGLCRATGSGVEKNQKLALDFFTKAANQRLPIAAWFLYVSLATDGDKAKDISWCRVAAEGGEPMAQTELGFCYTKGDSVTQNDKEAVKWFEKAAEQGNVPAQNNLGVMYNTGRGVAKDNKIAVQYFRSAAEGNWVPAQRSLGEMYENGLGVDQDKQEAFKWYSKAAINGDTIAQSYLGHYYLNGDLVTKNYTEAFKWLSQAAKGGDLNAQCSLGALYFNGNGVRQDYQAAFNLFANPAQKGVAVAQRNLGIMYNSGIGVPKNTGEALKWFQLAAAQGDEVAINNLQDLNMRRANTSTTTRRTRTR